MWANVKFYSGQRPSLDTSGMPCAANPKKKLSGQSKTTVFLYTKAFELKKKLS